MKKLEFIKPRIKGKNYDEDFRRRKRKKEVYRKR